MPILKKLYSEIFMKYDYQHEILKNPKLWGKIVAISTDDKIIEVADSYDELWEKMDKMGVEFSSYAVPKDPTAVHIRTFRVKSIKKHDWRPEYPVNFIGENGEIKTLKGK